MLKQTVDGLVFWQFHKLQSYPLFHAVFSRKGGVSERPFSGLNLCEKQGDCLEAVAENRRRIAQLFNVSSLSLLNQCHGKEMHTTPAKKGLSGDAWVTQLPGHALTILHADCQAALFYDPRKHVVAAVHAGWRGLVQNIYAATVQEMHKTFGCNPQDLIACIGPSLGPAKAEFIHYKTEFPPEFLPFQIAPNHFNLWKIAKMQLRQAAIPDSQIELAEMDTFSDPEHFFSYRRDKITGRNATVICLNNT